MKNKQPSKCCFLYLPNFFIILITEAKSEGILNTITSILRSIPIKIGTPSQQGHYTAIC